MSTFNSLAMSGNGSAEVNATPEATIAILKTDEIDSEITESVHQESLSTSALLYYCQCKILRPYSRLLCIMGLRPSAVENAERCCILSCCGYKHLVLVLALMCVGYILQYMTCFRRDRGFDYKNESTVEVKDHEFICYGNITFSYIVPSFLHFSAYLYALYLFRINENEQLQSLMERAFLVSGGSLAQQRVVYTLWISIGLSILWVTASAVTVSVMVADGTIVFHWLQHGSAGVTTLLKGLLVLSTLWHDMVQATLITSYCLQSQLLSLHVQLLREKLLQYVISHGDWMREIREFRKLLKYFNEDLAPIICILSIVNISFAASGIIWLLKFDLVDTETEPINGVSILNTVLWVLIAVAPFIQAARLTAACVALRDIGHEVRTRPFVYETTPEQDLDSILLYTSSLRMTSELFKVPVTGRYLCMAATIGTILVITLGQCHVL
ncbi:uncharacterized protein LOC111862296 isoform X2 [Cryptotermes secundus]|uniref:uncharacterized protein LOC111862296 isoform X2 n=1 Tax=Cryptotermes secundus TaxID=105785 RepID=UPI000CD7BFDA|nr:uncharacterized protein LOC111862296 isoform X2 [Cryptotermes secundus]